MASEQIPAEALEAASRALKARVAKFLLGRRAKLDFRTATVLQRNGVMSAGERVDHKGVPPELLTDPRHPRREPHFPPGPIIAMLERRQEGGVRWVIELSSLLFDADVRVREGALTYIRNEIVAEGRCTAKTAAAVDGQAARVAVADRATWQDAAVELHDALEDDLLLNVAGVEQSLSITYDEGYQKYLTRVLRPSFPSVEGLPLVAWNPRAERDKIERVVSEAAAKEDLVSALDHFYTACGHLPLAGGLSIASVLDRRGLKLADSYEQLWDQLWSWADRTGSPLGRYHVAQLYASRPQLIPDGRAGTLWGEIDEIVRLPSDGQAAGRWAEPWGLRCDLARHYCHHFETGAPGQSGERIAAVSWWMAERVARIFGTEPDPVRHVREVAVEAAYQFSSNVWQLAMPPIAPDVLRYGTLMMNSIWSLSMLAQINEDLMSRAGSSLKPEQRDRVDQAFVAGLVGLLMPPSTEMPVYAIDNGLCPAVAAYAGGDDGERAQGLAGFIRLVDELARPERFDELLGNLPSAGEAEGLMYCQFLRVSAYLGRMPADAVWKRLADPRWREPVLAKSPLRTLSTLCDALTQVATTVGDKWATYLPHFLAAAAENATADRERQGDLFACTVLASVCGDTTSALDRLTRGPRRADFVPLAMEWITKLDGLQPSLSPWAAGRIRALRSSLSSI